MPRKFWKQKNRYCWNSNLDEEMFLVLLRLYCIGYTCSRAARIIARYARKYRRNRISRQTINRYYLMFGDYLYEMLPDKFKVENFPLEPNEDTPADDEQRRLYNANVVLISLREVLYDRLEWDDAANQILIGISTAPLHLLLSALSKARRGYPLETFNAHFAYCVGSILISDVRPDEPRWRALYDVMRDTLESEPLDVRYNRSLRILKP